MEDHCTLWKIIVRYGRSLYVMGDQCTLWEISVRYGRSLYVNGDHCTLWEIIVRYGRSLFVMEDHCTLWEIIDFINTHPSTHTHNHSLNEQQRYKSAIQTCFICDVELPNYEAFAADK